MRVVLRDDVDTLGKKGDLVDVADGYARNYLVPRGLAIKATRGVVAQANAMRRNRDAREVKDRQAAEALVSQLAAKRVEVKARAGEGGKLFGSVTTADIVAAVQEQLGVELDRRNLTLDEPVRELGSVEVAVKLGAGVEAVVGV
ncbi:MAG: 50S ribosomal protein L9, partial [Acidimicrobiia bacterium]